jgi:hypothetical protein
MPGGGSPTPSIGAIAVTEGADSGAMAGDFPPCFAAITEGADSPAMTGAFVTAATIGPTEGHDGPALLGAFLTTASAALAAGNDVATITSLAADFGLVAVTGGDDSAAMAGMFTASGSAAVTELHDTATASASFLASASMSPTEGDDSGALAGAWGSAAAPALTEGHDLAAMAGGFLAAAVFGIGGGGEGHDSGAFAGMLSTLASMGITEGHDAFAAFSSGLEYHIYSNTGIGDPINYGSIVATTGLLEWTSSPLAFPGTWRFGVRAYNPVNGLEEENLDCSITLILDATGHDITDRPGPPTALRAFATAGGGIRVEWAYNTINPSPSPTGFHVYVGTLGVVNYSAIAATVSFAASIGGTFVANLAGLGSGIAYTIGVRAFNATAEEPNTNPVTVTADSSGPSAVVDLTATAIV